MTAPGSRQNDGTLPGGHVPVLLDEVLEALAPRDGAIYVDATFGAGGYSRAILDAADCAVWGLDRDPDAIAEGRPLAESYGGRLTLVEGRFGEMDDLVTARPIDGVALDLGVSSMQLDRPERGFSFRADGPLDMRMGGSGPSAADLVNGCPEAELADIIYRYGEERRSRRIARAIVEARRSERIERTLQLAEIVRAAVKPRGETIHPATRTFQALRIAVNDELAEIDAGLAAAERLLAPGGRLAVVAFHSLEDRKVKSFLRTRSGALPRTSRHLPATTQVDRAPTFELLLKGARKPTATEISVNPRARSARLRAARRTSADAWRPAASGGDS
ncbi:MAG: 16S rRNA (cytosine(1402)-N(4))-methyltransferase RsmH [Kiloniellales bacterium]|nr:16S rRNA (cytosine(1402)-N(4))-methyltransferase RsmH [Kiloniellales bacterium]MDJ0983035.1 16S rRNA (cytosine(1402)-N(4))-methyltransferase RsmH [Kiloniellales bacterium]